MLCFPLNAALNMVAILEKKNYLASHTLYFNALLEIGGMTHDIIIEIAGMQPLSMMTS